MRTSANTPEIEDRPAASPHEAQPRTRKIPWSVSVIVAWGALTTVLEWQHLVHLVTAPLRPIDSLRLLAAAVPVGAGGACCLWLAIQVSQRFRLRAGRWGPALVANAAAAAVAAMYMSAIALVQYRVVEELPASGPFNAGVRLLAEALHYGVLAAGVSVVTLARGLRRAAVFDRRLQRAVWMAERERVRADLRALKAEVSPRTLDVAVRSALDDLKTDAASAERTLFTVASVMREAILGAGVDVVSLEEERSAIDAFLLEISDVSPVRWDVGEGVEYALVPHFALWSLVVTMPGVTRETPRLVRVRRRGFAGRDLDITIRVGGATTVTEEMVEEREAEQGDREALSALRARLALMFGTRARLQTGGTAERGRWVRLVIPWRTDDDVPYEETDPSTVAASTAVAPPPATARISRVGAGVVVWACATAVFAWRWTLEAGPGAVMPPLASLLALALWRGAGLPIAGGLAWFAAVRAPLGVEGLGWRRLQVHFASLSLAILVSYVARQLERVLFGAEVIARASAGADVGPVMRALAVTVLYALVSVVAHVDVLARRRQQALGTWRALRRRRAESIARRTDAELRALKAELNPHFVGNALHAAMSLVRSDARAARELLESLVLLSQRAVERVALQEVALSDELADLEPFLAIERVRIGSDRTRLRITFDIPSRLADAAVPHFALQPLVENAVRHGLAPTGRGGHIVIRARQQSDGLLAIEVEDDGVGPHRDASRRSAPGINAGAGTGAMRARLRALYGPAARFDLAPGPTQGTIARILIPCRLLGNATGARLSIQ